MVLRFWGEPGVMAEDFAHLRVADAEGLTTGELADAARSRGFEALPWPGTAEQVAHHLARGRPIIVLLDTGAATMHYVVVVGWSGQRVTFHDPGVAPWRTLAEEDFLGAWNASGTWALLVLPARAPTSVATADARIDAPLPVSARASTHEDLAPGDDEGEDCDGLILRAVRLASEGRTNDAGRKLELAHTRCPDSPAPLRELAGLAFLESEWADASRLATEALSRDPSDSLSRRILAGSRFLARDVDGALDAWNEIDEPRLDLIEVHGSERVHYRAIAGQVGLEHGTVVTSRSFRWARRRLEEIPGVDRTRLSLRPRSKGNAHLEVAVSEPPVLRHDVGTLVRAGARAAAWSDLEVRAASPTGNGELWQLRGRWRDERPLIALALTVPAPGRPGVWRVEGHWDRQAYAPALRSSRPSGPAGETPTAPVRETRRRTALSYSDWLGPDVRMSFGTALERWDEGGRYLSVEPGIEFRMHSERLFIETAGGAWFPLGSGRRFGVASLDVQWVVPDEHLWTWALRAGFRTTSSFSPLSLWSGAGTGRARDLLLRAHPLLEADVVEGPIFGPSVWSSGVERTAYPWNLGLFRLGGAVFLDAAGVVGPETRDSARWQLDFGVGLRLAEAGVVEPLRVDLSRGARDGRWALSLGWSLTPNG